MKFFFKLILKVSAFYLQKQKSFIPKKKYFLRRFQYQNKKALFTGAIFPEVLIQINLPYLHMLPTPTQYPIEANRNSISFDH